MDKKYKHKPSYPRPTPECRNIVPWYKELDLNVQELQFVAEYISNGRNADLAYKFTHYVKTNSPASIGAKANAYLSQPKIQAAVRRYIDDYLVAKKNELDEKITKTLMEQAFYDPADFITPEGDPKFHSWDEVPPEKRCCIESIETKAYGKDADRTITTLKLSQRNAAIKQLTEFLALSGPKRVEITGAGGKPIKTVSLNATTPLADMTDSQLLSMLAEFQ